MSFNKIMKVSCIVIVLLILAVPMSVNAAIVAVARTSGDAMYWYVLDTATNNSTELQFGAATDKPVFGDWNNDGTFDAGVARASTIQWDFYYSIEHSGATGNLYGSSTYGNVGRGDKPIGVDGDSDGKWQAGVIVPNGLWYPQDGGTWEGLGYGGQTDTQMWGKWAGNTIYTGAVGRYNGAGYWNFYLATPTDFYHNFYVAAGATAIPYAYCLNGVWDVAVFENGIHTVYDLNGNVQATYNWGHAGDIPVFMGSTAIPEPVTLVVLGIGSLFLRRRVA
jgi:hypothetical protein